MTAISDSLKSVSRLAYNFDLVVILVFVEF